MIALCIGSAQNVWDDLKRAQLLLGDAPRLVVVCNFTGIYYRDRIDAWCTLHPEYLGEWIEKRAAKGFNCDYRRFAHVLAAPGADVQAVPYRWEGSSGLYMAQIAIDHLGATGVLLCGVPIEAEAGHIHHIGQWSDPDNYRPAFIQAHAAGLNIRSMSGWTAGLFGRPDVEWLSSLGVNVTAQAAKAAFKKGPIDMRIKMLVMTNYTPKEERRITVQYAFDQEYTVKREWGEDMVGRGLAEEIKGHRRKATDARLG